MRMTLRWLAVVMPAHVPSQLVLRLNNEINDIIQSSEVKDVLGAQTIALEPSTPDGLRRRIEREIEVWRPLAARVRVKER